MQSAIVLALLLGSSVGVFGNECAAGYKHKADLTGLMCVNAATDTASCNSECCVANTATCGGISGITCAWDSYAGGDDAWKKTAATAKNKNTNCCKKKATCSQATCPDGKQIQNPTVKCAGGAASCALGDVCCKDNVKTCGGAATGKNTCTDTTTAIWGSSAAWKKTAIGGTQTKADFTTACCKAILKCDKGTCPAGQKLVAAKATTNCLSEAGAVTSVVSDCNRDLLADAGGKKANPCCEKDTATCGGFGGTCGAGKTASASNAAWKGTTTTVGDAAKYITNCCAALATCAQATCAAGQKKKANSAATTCTGLVATCPTTCCEVDTAKCGGLTGIVCKYGFFDESGTWTLTGTKKTPQATMDAWKNKAANSTNKNTNCCTPREVCKVPVGTTTPAPGVIVVTTTPAAPALKFSEHKSAVEEGSDSPWGANMVWLGVGGLIGMGVLMVVQGLRSKMQAPSSEADGAQADAEDARVLLSTRLE